MASCCLTTHSIVLSPILHPTSTVSHHPLVLLLTLDFNDCSPCFHWRPNDAENGPPLHPNARPPPSRPVSSSAYKMLCPSSLSGSSNTLHPSSRPRCLVRPRHTYSKVISHRIQTLACISEFASWCACPYLLLKLMSTSSGLIPSFMRKL
jgi:hypothetical protein